MSFVLPSTTTRAHRAAASAGTWLAAAGPFHHGMSSQVKLRIRAGLVTSGTPKPPGEDHLDTSSAALTAGSGSSMIKLLRVFILCLAASSTARADEAAQCRAHAGTFLTGNVTQGPTFAPGHSHKGVELSHTHLTLLSDQDGLSYHVAIDNAFATGYDAAGESIPAPLSTIRTGDRLALCGKLFTRGGLGIDWVHTNCLTRPTPPQPHAHLNILAPPR